MTDLYELTMMNAYMQTGKADVLANFDVFYRKKEHLDFAVCAGLEQVIDYINNLHFEKDELDYQNNPKDFAKIVDRIDSTLFGLFPE